MTVTKYMTDMKKRQSAWDVKQVNLPWEFFQASTLVTSGAFERERPSGTQIWIDFVLYDSKFKLKKDFRHNFSAHWFNSPTNPQSILVRFVGCNSPLGLLLQTLVSDRARWGRGSHRGPLWGRRSHWGRNMGGGGCSTCNHGTGLLGTTHLLHLEEETVGMLVLLEKVLWACGAHGDSTTPV